MTMKEVVNRNLISKRDGLGLPKDIEANYVRDVVAGNKDCKIAKEVKFFTNCDSYCTVTWKHIDAFYHTNSTAYPILIYSQQYIIVKLHCVTMEEIKMGVISPDFQGSGRFNTVAQFSQVQGKIQ